MEQIEAARRQSERKLRFTYFAELELLIITIATFLHESLHLHLYRKIETQIFRMGLERIWQPIGATKRRQGQSSNESDSGGVPCPPRGKNPWATLIIEAAKAQSWQLLRMKMRKWFADSGGEVSNILSPIFMNSSLTLSLR
jgi:hypothetical protein